MGYRTYFSLDIMRENCVKFTTELVEQLTEAFKEKGLIGWVFSVTPWIGKTMDAVHLDPEDESGWDDYDWVMPEISKRFPDCVFCLHGEGEDRTDTWDAYYLNGESEKCYELQTIPLPRMIHWPGYKQEPKPERTTLYKSLQYHIGHNVEIASYGDGINISLECIDCGCVIFDTDLYDLIGKE